MINMYQDDEQRKGKMPRTNKMSSRAFCIVAALVVLTTSSIMVQMEQYSYVNYTPSHGMAMLRASEGNEVMAERKMAMKRSAKMMMREEVLDALDESMKDISENADAVKQMLVHHGQLSLQVWKGELQGLSEMVETLVTKENHGYVESRSSSSLGYSESNKRLVMNVKIRIKSQFFHETVSSIQKLVGQERVASLDISSEDVTDSYIDASARADTLDASRKALQTLLKSATNISEILEVQRELNKMNQQYESSQKRAMHLKKEAVSYKLC